MSAPAEVLQAWAANMPGEEPHVYAEDCTPECASECAGVTTFPTLPLDWFGPDGRFDPLLVEAHAWAWRSGDTMPDSEQSRRDSLADAETLRLTWDPALCRLTDALANADRAPWAARAAFRAVPGLRHGEPR